jgi:multiple sugar transport system substrate-binding protein
MNPSQFFCINQASENADAAAAWINFFVNDPSAGVILGNDRGIPCNSEVRAAVGEELSAVDKEVYKLFDLTADYSTERDPNAPNDQAILDAWQAIAFEVAYGVKTVDEAAAEFYTAFQDLLTQ